MRVLFVHITHVYYVHTEAMSHLWTGTKQLRAYGKRERLCDWGAK